MRIPHLEQPNMSGTINTFYWLCCINIIPNEKHLRKEVFFGTIVIYEQN